MVLEVVDLTTVRWQPWKRTWRWIPTFRLLKVPTQTRYSHVNGSIPITDADRQFSLTWHTRTCLLYRLSWLLELEVDCVENLYYKLLDFTDHTIKEPLDFTDSCGLWTLKLTLCQTDKKIFKKLRLFSRYFRVAVYVSRILSDGHIWKLSGPFKMV